MKKSGLVAVALALGLTACAQMRAVEMGGVRTQPNPHAPNVYVVGGKYIVVDQEPIVVHGKNVWIVWQLPDRPSPYRFPANGIVITNPGGEIINCQVVEDGYRFRCFDKNSKPQRYKYTINVTDGTNLLDPLDPVIAND